MDRHAQFMFKLPKATYSDYLNWRTFIWPNTRRYTSSLLIWCFQQTREMLWKCRWSNTESGRISSTEKLSLRYPMIWIACANVYFCVLHTKYDDERSVRTCAPFRTLRKELLLEKFYLKWTKMSYGAHFLTSKNSFIWAEQCIFSFVMLWLLSVKSSIVTGLSLSKRNNYAIRSRRINKQTKLVFDEIVNNNEFIRKFGFI